MRLSSLAPVIDQTNSLIDRFLAQILP